MTKPLPDIVTNSGLIWLPEAGIGFHPKEEIEYDKSYFENYRKLDETPMGKQLTYSRVGFVRKYTDLDILDIGIGGGAFVEAADCYGYDVNEKAVSWLLSCKRFRTPYSSGVDVATFWDSLEHIRNIDGLLLNIKKFVFISIPIFDSVEHVLKSKHYKPGEHLWYYSHDGLINFMASQGFELLECNKMESDLGREGINSYAFKRVYSE